MKPIMTALMMLIITAASAAKRDTDSANYWLQYCKVVAG
jgi:hypothetical protein